MSSFFAPPDAVPILDGSIALNYQSLRDHESYLRHADYAWLSTVARGAIVMLASVGVGIACGVAAALIKRTADPLTVALLGSVGPVMTIVGAWMLTEPDPSGRGEQDYGIARKTSRVALCIAMFVRFISLLPSIAEMSPQATIIVGVITIVGGLVSMSGQFAQLTYMRKLAMRIPNESLSGFIRVLRTVFGWAVPALVILAMLVAMVFYSRSGGIAMALALAAIVIGLSILAWGLGYLFMLGWFAQQVSVQAKLAANEKR